MDKQDPKREVKSKAKPQSHKGLGIDVAAHVKKWAKRQKKALDILR